MADAPLRVQVDTEAVVAAVLKAVHADIERACAQTAEGIARAIEAHGRASHDFLDGAELPANPRYAKTIVLTIEQAAAIARNYPTPAVTWQEEATRGA